MAYGQNAHSCDPLSPVYSLSLSVVQEYSTLVKEHIMCIGVHEHVPLLILLMSKAICRKNVKIQFKTVDLRGEADFAYVFKSL